VQRGDVVAYVLPNLPETHLVIWGAETAGIALAINPLLEGAQIGDLLRSAQARWIVTLAPHPDPELWKRICVAVPLAREMLRGVLAVDLTRHLPGQPAGSARATSIASLPADLDGVPVLDFHVELAREAGEALTFEPPGAEDIAAYLCTGGTTGLPKIARHTHRNEIANALQLGAVVGEDFYAPGRCTLTALPLFHVNAQVGTGLGIFAHGGHALLAAPAGYRTPGLLARFWEIIAHHRVHAFSGVPTIFAGLLQAPRAGLDLSCLAYAISGAAPMPVELFNKFQAETGMRILEGYGLTEGACASSINPPGTSPRIGSIGLRLPWQPMKPMMLDEQGGYLRDAAVDEIGILAIRGPNVFPGYLNPDHDHGLWIERVNAAGHSERWLNSGDLGRQDADGFIWLTGRKKELIIRGGHNIDPKIIEDVLAGHPAVAICAAVGRPDPHSGEVPVAYAQLRPGQQATEEELLAWANARITERAAQLKSVRIIAGLPLTAIGKIFKPRLNMLEIESVVREEAKDAGVELLNLDVVQDTRRGLLARYLASGDAAALAGRLGRYTFASEAAQA
jgi:acyl-CoA synthetase (AMP-forming)/AMP-acid ligase II